MASGLRPVNLSRRPLGQRTSTQSILVATPSPKWTRMSLLESKLEPERTSSIRMRGPALTRMRAPMASRFDFHGVALSETAERPPRKAAATGLCAGWSVGVAANVVPTARKAIQWFGVRI